MKRSTRMQTVRNAVDELERQRAQELAASERAVQESEAKLAELEAYQANYVREFSNRVGRGIAGSGLRDYQAFLARLQEAIRQQAVVVARARALRDAEHERWRTAAQRSSSVGRLIDRWQSDERAAADRQEQRETDERAQTRAPGAQLDSSGIFRRLAT
jgi:flagellar FliJ protein